MLHVEIFRVEKMSEPKMVTTAVIISLVAGILIILGSLSATIERIGMILGIVSGIFVLISAIMLKIRPGEGARGLRLCCRMWGTMILAFSIVSLFAGSVDGFIGAILIGGILGIVGAALALVVKV
jgi:FtsH-binding integral membrane protein